MLLQLSCLVTCTSESPGSLLDASFPLSDFTLLDEDFLSIDPPIMYPTPPETAYNFVTTTAIATCFFRHGEGSARGCEEASRCCYLYTTDALPRLQRHSERAGNHYAKYSTCIKLYIGSAVLCNQMSLPNMAVDDSGPNLRGQH